MALKSLVLTKLRAQHLCMKPNMQVKANVTNRKSDYGQCKFGLPYLDKTWSKQTASLEMFNSAID